MAGTSQDHLLDIFNRTPSRSGERSATTGNRFFSTDFTRSRTTPTKRTATPLPSPSPITPPPTPDSPTINKKMAKLSKNKTSTRSGWELFKRSSVKEGKSPTPSDDGSSTHSTRGTSPARPLSSASSTRTLPAEDENARPITPSATPNHPTITVVSASPLQQMEAAFMDASETLSKDPNASPTAKDILSHSPGRHSTLPAVQLVSESPPTTLKSLPITQRTVSTPTPVSSLKIDQQFGNQKAQAAVDASKDAEQQASPSNKSHERYIDSTRRRSERIKSISDNGITIPGLAVAVAATSTSRHKSSASEPLIDLDHANIPPSPRDPSKRYSESPPSSNKSDVSSDTSDASTAALINGVSSAEYSRIEDNWKPGMPSNFRAPAPDARTTTNYGEGIHFLAHTGIRLQAWQRWVCSECSCETHWENKTCSNMQCVKPRTPEDRPIVGYIGIGGYNDMMR
ncbi:hypothetical protein K402DRAFT_450667 [Aulographum hederae CBS 113979]|uniref:Uncharacterized protein n=1 Tax=Aulographum hederae CBS 113979 TaxID=1176131 RepID=A0A6G1HD67_9PEZI|nr:hypothetical protein K402DRAFT_450667 [Aulographum hederae CBS 113979]